MTTSTILSQPHMTMTPTMDFDHIPPPTFNQPTISPASLLTSTESPSASSAGSPEPYISSYPSPPPEGQSPSEESESAPKKKRKSWGQVLPEPTTNLPPRKRAKTEAEKQQRKYERVQRNRQAAHNSRMRKQEEMDRLTVENSELRDKCAKYEEDLRILKEQLAGRRSSAVEIKVESDHDSTYDSDHTSPTSPPFDSFSMNITQSADTHSAAMC